MIALLDGALGRHAPRHLIPDRNSLVSLTPPTRTENRIPKRVFVRLSHPENGESEITPTADIGGHGVRVISERFWQPDIRLSVQSVHGDLYSRARVVHCRPLANASSWVIGLELFHPSEDWINLSQAP
jgi:hypothetical protein